MRPECVQRSGLDSVDAVYLTGGSSALRPLVHALQAAMPLATLVEAIALAAWPQDSSSGGYRQPRCQPRSAWYQPQP